MNEGRWVDIVDGRPFQGRLPSSVELPETVDKGDKLVTNLVAYERGAPGWEDALERWMFHQGYVTEESLKEEA